MHKKWKGSYTIEMALILLMVLSMLFLLLSMGIYWYDRCILESNAATYAVSKEEQVLPGILLFDEDSSIGKDGDQVVYSLKMKAGSGYRIAHYGEKKQLYEVRLEDLRRWKYLEGKSDEDK